MRLCVVIVQTPRLIDDPRRLFQKAFGWDSGQTGGSPSGPQTGGVGGQGAQGLVHWMSVMAEHMDPTVSHYMGWNQEVSSVFVFLWG